MIYFLTTEEVIAIHGLLVSEFGGADGIRSRNLLLSALAPPQTSFAGRYLHDNVFVMAAAYAYHIIKNHSFVDGNKRTGIFCAVTFLERNEHNVNFTQDELYDLAIGVATSQISKEELAKILKRKRTSL